jgi:hypothetical protein
MIAAKIKSITAREIFAKVPSVKKKLFQQSANMQMKMSYGIMSEIRVWLENTSCCINRKLFIMNNCRCFDKRHAAGLKCLLA